MSFFVRKWRLEFRSFLKTNPKKNRPSTFSKMAGDFLYKILRSQCYSDIMTLLLNRTCKPPSFKLSIQSVHRSRFTCESANVCVLLNRTVHHKKNGSNFPHFTKKNAPGFDSCHSFLDASVSQPLSWRHEHRHMARSCFFGKLEAVLHVCLASIFLSLFSYHPRA